MIDVLVQNFKAMFPDRVKVRDRKVLYSFGLKTAKVPWQNCFDSICGGFAFRLGVGLPFLLLWVIGLWGHTMTFTCRISPHKWDEVNAKGEGQGTLLEAYWKRNAFHWVKLPWTKRNATLIVETTKQPRLHQSKPNVVFWEEGRENQSTLRKNPQSRIENSVKSTHIECEIEPDVIR